MTADLDRHVGDLGQQLYKTLINEFVDQLDTENGTIKNNTRNLQLIGAIDKMYNKFMAKNGPSIAGKIVEGADKINEYNVDYYSQYADGKSKYAATNKTIKKTIDDRLGVGDKTHLKEGGYMDNMLKDTQVKSQIKNLSFREVVKGAGFQEFKKGLGDMITGNKERMGAFQQYYRNYSYDIFVQVDRTESTLFAKELDLKFFFYEGMIIDTSRDFCIERAGKLFSTEEAEKWIDDPWIKKAFEKKYITSYDPIVDMGLFGCRHSPRFVSKEVAEHIRPELKKTPVPNKEPKPEPKKEEKPASVPKQQEKPVPKERNVVAAGKPVSKQFSNINEKIQSKVDNSLSIIDEVHGDGVLKDIPIEPLTNPGATLGRFRYMRSGEPFDIQMKRSDKAFELTFAHEMGHYLDLHAIGKAGSMESGKATGEMDNLLKVLKKTNAVKAIQEMYDSKKATLNGKEIPLGKGILNHFDYLLRPHEIFARAYAQFIAKRSTDKKIKDQLKGLVDNAARLGYSQQWDDDDFTDAEREFEALFVKLGWMSIDE